MGFPPPERCHRSAAVVMEMQQVLVKTTVFGHLSQITISKSAIKLTCMYIRHGYSSIARSIDQAAILGINGSTHNLDPGRKLMTQVTRSTLEKFTAVLVDDFQCNVCKLTLCQPESHSSVECASLEFESSAEQI